MSAEVSRRRYTAEDVRGEIRRVQERVGSDSGSYIQTKEPDTLIMYLTGIRAVFEGFLDDLPYHDGPLMREAEAHKEQADRFYRKAHREQGAEMPWQFSMALAQYEMLSAIYCELRSPRIKANSKGGSAAKVGGSAV